MDKGSRGSFIQRAELFFTATVINHSCIYLSIHFGRCVITVFVMWMKRVKEVRYST
jgi:hypothetical protein